ncbi:MAG: beta-ketoacyl-ACP synthase III [Bacillota bacterium]
MIPRRAAVVGVGSSLGQRVLTNQDLEKMVDTSDQWIRERTGILTRYILEQGEATSDLATRAALKALEHCGKAPEDLDLILVATATPDMIFPATSCMVQRNLGAHGAAAFDILAGCSGFVYGIATAASFVEARMYENVLVIGSDALSRITDYEDRATCVLFGDGAGAAVVSPAQGDEGILASCLGADGHGASVLCLPAGGSLMPASAETVAGRQHFLKMDGKRVFEFAVKVMGKASRLVLEKAGLDIEDVSLFIPHQANIRIIEAARKRFRVPMERMALNLDRYGNMSTASIPVALDEAARSGRLKVGDVVLMVAFGAGLTWGASVVRWGEIAQGGGQNG